MWLTSAIMYIKLPKSERSLQLGEVSPNLVTLGTPKHHKNAISLRCVLRSKKYVGSNQAQLWHFTFAKIINYLKSASACY
jgi:hypothetical protein